jgi:hypothetical protein
MRPIHFLSAAAALLVLTASSQAFACRCSTPAPTRAELFAKSSVVFVGTVADLGEPGPEPVTITIEKVYKGDAGDRKVATIPDDGRGTSCDFFMSPRVGEPYLFFDSDLDAINVTGCHSSIFGFDVSPLPADLNAWIAEDGSTPPEGAAPEATEGEGAPADAPEPTADTKPASGGCATSSQVGLPTPPVRSSLALFVGVLALGVRRRR